MQSFDPDKRQIPMGFGWSVIFRPLEDGGDFGLLFSDHAFCNYRLKRPIVAMNTWWEPERDPKPAVGALRYSCFKRARSKGAEESRDVQQILMRLIIHPARYRIAAKGQNQRGDGMVDFGVAGNGRDPRWLHIHGDILVGDGVLRVQSSFRRASAGVRDRAASDRPSRRSAASRLHADSWSGRRAGS